MDVFDSKCFVFFVSTGRTGTKFFGNNLSGVVDNCFSIHEPDAIEDFTLQTIKSKIKYFGFHDAILGKITRNGGVRNNSIKLLSGKQTESQFISHIKKTRKKFYENIDSKLIIESSYGWIGATHLIPKIFKNYKIVYVVRSPFRWVESGIRWERPFGKKDWIYHYGLGRITPKLIGEHYTNFNQETVFTKLCWYWNRINTIMNKASEEDSNSTWIRFEDVFQSNNSSEHINALLNFISKHNDRTFEYDSTKFRISEKVNESTPVELNIWNNESIDYLTSTAHLLIDKFKYRHE